MSAEAIQPGFGVAPEPVPSAAKMQVSDDMPAGFAPEPVKAPVPEDATVQRPAVKAAHRGEPDETSEARKPDGPEHDGEHDDQDDQPSWWHRDHPISAALFGFYSGMVFAIVVPGAYAAIMEALYSETTVTHHFAYVLLVFVVPIVLAIIKATRRFGLFMLLGVFSTLLVVSCVAGGVGYYLYKHG